MTEKEEVQGAAAGLQVETTEVNAVVRSISVEIDPKRVRKAFDRAYRELGRNARVRGFRPGKVPRSVLEKLYGAGVPEQIERELVAQTLADAVELAELAPVSEPAIESEPPTPDGPFRYTARIEIRPPIELPSLEGLPAKRPPIDVSEDEVQTELESLRERIAPLLEEADETPVARGHFVTLDFEGRVDGDAFEGGSGKDMDVEIGSGRLVGDFEDQLVGARTGEDREVTITFPDDYAEETLAGKQAVFRCHVSAVKQRDLPELDDEFAKDLSEEFDSLAELREHVRSDLVAQRERGAEAMLHRTLLDSLIERSEFEVPPGMVERQLESHLRSMQRQFEGRVEPDALQAELVRMREQGRSGAERRVREILLLQEVARAEGLSVSDGEVDERLEEMASAQDVEASTLKQMASEQGWRDAIESELLDRKALDFLAAGATVEETTEA